MAKPTISGPGRLDAMVANLAGDNITLLLGNGAGGFAAASNSPLSTGDMPERLVLGDINNDGSVDVVIANFGSDNVTVLLGNGFSTASGSPLGVGDGPFTPRLGDLNGDGKLDLVVTLSGEDKVKAFLGEGGGGFTLLSSVAVGDDPLGLALGDLNGDGILDLVTTNFLDDNLSVLLGNGSGGFSPAAGAPISAGNGPFDVALGDLNGDGKLDIVALNQLDSTVSVFLNTGAGIFASAGPDIPVGNIPNTLALGDLNFDGNLDIATANGGDNTVSVLLGNGIGGFSAVAPVNVGASPHGVALGDVNNDGKPDIVTANNGPDSGSVFLGNGAGGFAAAGSFGTGLTPSSVALGYFDDGFQRMLEDQALIFATAKGNAITLADIDAVGPETLTLSVLHGSLVLATLAGLTVNSGANGTASLTVTGTLADLNAALDGLTYLPTGNYNGLDTLNIQLDDHISGTASTAIAIEIGRAHV